MGASVHLYLFDDIMKVPVIGLPISNHDNSQHAANENLDLEFCRKLITTLALTLSKL